MQAYQSSTKHMKVCYNSHYYVPDTCKHTSKNALNCIKIVNFNLNFI